MVAIRWDAKKSSKRSDSLIMSLRLLEGLERPEPKTGKHMPRSLRVSCDLRGTPGPDIASVGDFLRLGGEQPCDFCNGMVASPLVATAVAAILRCELEAARYRTPSAIERHYLALSRIRTQVGVLNCLILSHLGSSTKPFKSSGKQESDRGRDSRLHLRPRLNSQLSTE